jgi:hypothetical protein
MHITLPVYAPSNISFCMQVQIKIHPCKAGPDNGADQMLKPLYQQYLLQWITTIE